jgi:HEAT repeat protein
MFDRRWMGPLVLLGCLLPTLSVAWQALHTASSEAGEGELTPQQKLLARMPADATVLINVTAADLPASPDILDLGKRSTKALERCLADNVDAEARRQCAFALELLGDRRALATLRGALDDWEVPVRLQVVRALRGVPDASSVEPLLKLYDRKDEELRVRLAVLKTLGSIGDQRVVRRLRDELRQSPEKKKDATDMRPAAFDALWSNRHLMSRETLVGDTRAALKSDNRALALSATQAAAELRSPRLVPALIPLMEHPDTEVRNKAVYALGRIGDAKATDALLERLPRVRESRMLNNIAFALERLDKKAFYRAIVGVIGHKQAVIRLNAAFVLGDVRHSEGLPLLLKAIADPSDFVRTSAVAAVGKLTVDDATRNQAQTALEPLTRSSNLTLREEAVHALHAVTKGGRRDLLFKLFDDVDSSQHPDVVRRAAIALGRAGDKRASRYLVDCLVNDWGCAYRDVIPFVRKHGGAAGHGRLLLAWARDDVGLTDIVAELKPAGVGPIARSALDDNWLFPESKMTVASLRVLGSLGKSDVSPLLKQRAESFKTWARVHSQVALARLGNEDAPRQLVTELEQLPAAWQPRFVRAMSDIRESAVKSKLEADLEQKSRGDDAHVAMAASAVALNWDPERGIFRMLDALASGGSLERQLAAQYLITSRERKVTWVLRRALAREGREDTRDRLRAILDERL